MKSIRERISRAPKPALILGKTLFLAGGILILAAVFGRAGLMNLNAERAEGKLPPVPNLAQAFPQYPTWLVPEGPVGYAVATLLLLAGMLLASIAADVLKRNDVRSGRGW